MVSVLHYKYRNRTQRNSGQKHLSVAVTNMRREETDFSGNLASSRTLRVQCTALNDVNGSCECSALLQIQPHDFKHIINGHLGEVSCIGLAQHYTEILWLYQRENPVVYSGTRLGQKTTHSLPEICFSHQQSFYPRATEGMPVSDNCTVRQAKLSQITAEGKAGCLLGMLSAFWDFGYTSSGFCSASFYFERIRDIGMSCIVRMDRD